MSTRWWGGKERSNGMTVKGERLVEDPTKSAAPPRSRIIMDCGFNEGFMSRARASGTLRGRAGPGVASMPHDCRTLLIYCATV